MKRMNRFFISIKSSLVLFNAAGFVIPPPPPLPPELPAPELSPPLGAEVSTVKLELVEFVLPTESFA